MISFDETIFSKYGITYMDKKHVYNLDLSKRNFYLSKTTPYLPYFNGKYHEITSWSDTLVMLISSFIKYNMINIDQLLNMKFNWTKQHIFSLEDIFINSKRIILDSGAILLNTNISSTHLMYVLYDVIKYFHIDHDIIKIKYIKKPGYESKEIRNFFYLKAKNSITEFLIISKNFSEEKTASFFSGINKIDKIFKQEFPSFYSLLLFEDRIIFSTIKSKFKRIVNCKSFNDKNKKIINYILDILTEYYRYSYS